MSGLRAAHRPPNFTSTRLPSIFSHRNFNNLPLKKSEHQTQIPIQFRIHCKNGSNNDGQPAENGTNNGENGKVKNGRPGFNLKWVDLLLDPDPNNVVAVGLTGLLTWASVQVLWHLFIISGAVLIAALKYTLVAVVLIFILVTLL